MQPSLPHRAPHAGKTALTLALCLLGLGCRSGYVDFADDPCAGWTCSGHGVCGVNGAGQPACACFEGYHNDGADRCVADDGPVDCTVAADCDDHNPCTDDSCLAGYCQHENNTAPCDDGLFCTETDVCQGGGCSGTGNPCDPLACDEATDSCHACASDNDCDDSNPCTDDRCAAGGCQYENNTDPCDDGLFCNGADTCAGGSCAHAGDPCAPLACDEAQDVCVGDDTWYGLDGSDFGPWSVYQELGSASGRGVSETLLDSENASLALDAQGRPVVAWKDNLYADNEIYVKRFDGVEWVELGAGSASGGGISDNPDYSDEPSLALDAQDRPVVAWQDRASGVFQIYVKRFDGSGWVEVGTGSASGGGISDSLNGARSPSLALDPDDNPVVAWGDDSSGNNEIYVKRFDGNGWIEVGTGSATGGGVSDNAGGSWAPSLALDGAGYPVIAWEDNTDDNVYYEIYVKRFDGSAWVEVGTGSATGGGVSDNEGASYNPSLALDPDGNPVVVWDDITFGGIYDYELYLKAFDGNAWVELGGSATGGGVSDTPDRARLASIVTGADGLPVVAWQDDSGIYVKRYDGAAWVEVGTGSAEGGGVSAGGSATGTPMLPSLATNASGRLAVAWHTSPFVMTHSEIFVRRYDTQTDWWEDIPPATASGGGVSDNPGQSEFASLAVDGSGNPVVAWHDNTTGPYEVYIKAHDGSQWQEVGAGSASGGGISDGVSNANDVCMTLGPDGEPVVAWCDQDSENIYVLQFDGSAWAEVGTGSASGNGVSDTSRPSRYPGLAVDASGLPLVAWQEDVTGPGTAIYLKRFDGSAWVEQGSGSASGDGVSDSSGSAHHPCVGFDGSGAPLLAWSDTASGTSQIYLRRFDGGAWVEMGSGSASGGGVSDGSGSSQAPDLAIDTNGLAVLAWVDDTAGNDEIYVKRFDGGAWVEAGAGSASGGGVSDNPGDSIAPSLVIAANGHPVVAWQDDTNEPYYPQIYVKRFDGAAWVELAPGSASAGGLSNSREGSYAPSAGIEPGTRICVAWHELGPTLSTEILVRCADCAP